MAQLPPDIQDVLDQVDRADAAADLLVGPLSDEQLHWQPDGGRGWSVAQCLEHLAAINELYGRAIGEAVAAARARGWSRKGPLAPGPLGQRFIASQEPPVTRRVRSPGSVRPGSGAARADILARYHAAHEMLRGLVRDAASIDANRATYPNPFLKLLRFKVATGVQLLPTHDRRHLWQAEQVIRHPLFPGRQVIDTGGAPLPGPSTTR
jgi:hypothetical protein